MFSEATSFLSQLKRLGGQNSPGQISPFVSAKSALGKYVGWHISPTVFFLMDMDSVSPYIPTSEVLDPWEWFLGV